MSVASENEALKLTASWLNSVSIMLVGTGVILPLLNEVLGTNPLGTEFLVLLICSCGVGAAGLHLVGRRILLAGIQ